MNLIEKIIAWWTSLFNDSPVVKLDGGLDLVIENKEVIVEEAEEKPKAKKVTKKKTSKKKASKKKASKKKSSKKKEK